MKTSLKVAQRGHWLKFRVRQKKSCYSWLLLRLLPLSEQMSLYLNINYQSIFLIFFVDPLLGSNMAAQLWRSSTWYGGRPCLFWNYCQGRAVGLMMTVIDFLIFHCCSNMFHFPFAATRMALPKRNSQRLKVWSWQLRELFHTGMMSSFQRSNQGNLNLALLIQFKVQ